MRGGCWLFMLASCERRKNNRAVHSPVRVNQHAPIFLLGSIRSFCFVVVEGSWILYMKFKGNSCFSSKLLNLRISDFISHLFYYVYHPFSLTKRHQWHGEMRGGCWLFMLASCERRKNNRAVHSPVRVNQHAPIFLLGSIRSFCFVVVEGSWILYMKFKGNSCFSSKLSNLRISDFISHLFYYVYHPILWEI